MREDEFRQWLKNHSGLAEATQSNVLSRCRRIERQKGSLDIHFAQDGCRNLLEQATDTAQDKLEDVSVARGTRIASQSSAYNNAASLKHAIRAYLAFVSWRLEPGSQEPIASFSVRSPRRTLRDRAKAAQWPEWPTPTEQDALLLARVTIPYIRFLNPAIVSLIVEDNERQRDLWSRKLSDHGIDSRLYLWKGSSCAFPGIRRATGGKETANAQKVAERDEPLEQALVVDSNHYPKEIWSFTFLGKRFPNFGPEGYSLAHLLDHKTYKNRGADELITEAYSKQIGALYGLFTCASNAVYIPSSLIKPTDFSFALRNLMQRKAANLYSGICNLLPKGTSFKTLQAPEWELDNFDWHPPVGATENISAFLAYRLDLIGRLLSND